MSINFSIDSKLDKSNFKKYKIGIVKSEWNNNITDSLINSCMSFLLDSGIIAMIFSSSLALLKTSSKVLHEIVSQSG